VARTMANTENGVKIREVGNNQDGRSSSEIGRGQGAAVAVAVAVGAGAGGVMSNYCKICTVHVWVVMA